MERLTILRIDRNDYQSLTVYIYIYGVLKDTTTHLGGKKSPRKHLKKPKKQVQ
jgi:hypothetical protein